MEAPPRSSPKSPPLIVAVLGPTASGKSQLALRLATALGGDIVGCDALQLRRGLPILTAKPTAAELAAVRHHLIGVLPIEQAATAAHYAQLAEQCLAELAAARRPAVLCGGSGLYLRALCDGLFAGPASDPALREQLRQAADRAGVAALHRQLATVDPVAAARIGENDYVRIERALEVFTLTGRPLSDWQAAHRQQLAGGPRYPTLRLGLDPGAGPLRQRIEQRTAQMLDAGLLDEVAAQRAAGGLRDPPLGYALCCQHLDGQLTRPGLAMALAQQTAQYARRQRTWFRREPGITWYADASAVPVADIVAAVLQATARSAA